MNTFLLMLICTFLSHKDVSASPIWPWKSWEEVANHEKVHFYSGIAESIWTSFESRPSIEIKNYSCLVDGIYYLNPWQVGNVSIIKALCVKNPNPQDRTKYSYVSKYIWLKNLSIFEMHPIETGAVVTHKIFDESNIIVNEDEFRMLIPFINHEKNRIIMLNVVDGRIYCNDIFSDEPSAQIFNQQQFFHLDMRNFRAINYIKKQIETSDWDRYED